jgi:hypothetical protein
MAGIYALAPEYSSQRSPTFVPRWIYAFAIHCLPHVYIINRSSSMHRSQQVQLEEALSGRAVERRAFAGKVKHTYVNFTIWSQFLCPDSLSQHA